MDTISDPTDGLNIPTGGKYTESKLVWFTRLSSPQVIYEKEKVCRVYTFEEINSEIGKFVRDGWTPVNVSVIDTWNFSILFCR